MRQWKPQTGVGRWLAAALLACAIIGAALVGWQIGRAFALPAEEWPIGGPLYGQILAFIALVGLAIYLAYRVAAAFSLRYALDRNGLYVSWLGNRAVVPLARIESIETGLPETLSPLAVALRSVGYYRGQLRLPGGRQLRLFSTRHPAQSLIVSTSDGVYAISPADAEGFVQDLEQRRRLGAIQQLSATIERGRRFFYYAFWEDRVARWGLVVAFALNLAILGVVMLVYPGLPAEIALRYNESGQLAELRPRHQILFLPLAACILALLNLGLGMSLHGREPAGARLLQLGSVVIQLLFAVAVAAALSA